MTCKEELKHEQSLHEARMKLQAKLVSAPKSKTGCKETEVFSHWIAKLPKFVIAKFGGSFTDWQKFWGQFSEAIDKSSLPSWNTAQKRQETWLCVFPF